MEQAAIVDGCLMSAPSTEITRRALFRKVDYGPSMYASYQTTLGYHVSL